jgi:hypothetical protein
VEWLVVFCLAAPHLLYAFIWYHGGQWRRIFEKRSVLVFEIIAWVLKGASAALSTHLTYEDIRHCNI